MRSVQGRLQHSPKQKQSDGHACTFPRFNKMKSRPLCKAWLACEKEFVRSHVSLQRVGAAACFPHPFQKTPSHSLPFLPCPTPRKEGSQHMTISSSQQLPKGQSRGRIQLWGRRTSASFRGEHTPHGRLRPHLLLECLLSRLDHPVRDRARLHPHPLPREPVNHQTKRDQWLGNISVESSILPLVQKLTGTAQA